MGLEKEEGYFELRMETLLLSLLCVILSSLHADKSVNDRETRNIGGKR